MKVYKNLNGRKMIVINLNRILSKKYFLNKSLRQYCLREIVVILFTRLMNEFSIFLFFEFKLRK